jgi:uncharacterized protein (TIGR03437 family)
MSKFQRSTLVLSFLFSALLPMATPGRAQTAEEFFDDSSIKEIRLILNPADWATLRQNYLDSTVYPADFTCYGATLHIGIKARGHGSRSPDKPNLDLDFKKYTKSQRFLGLKSVSIKANNQDASMMHERIAMKLLRRAGLPAPRIAPVRVFVNDEYFGFYHIGEYVDESFLDRNFGESNGYLYKWNDAPSFHFEYLGPDPAAYSPVLFDPKNHDSDPDPAPIVDMVRTVNEVADAEFSAAVSPYLDLKLFAAELAVESFLSNFDGLISDIFGMNNFYFYRFQGTTRSQFIAWDTDNSFDWEQREIFTGIDANILSRRALAVPDVRAAYLAMLAHAAGLAGGPGGWLEQEIEHDYQQIRDLALNDPHKQCSDAGVMHACTAAEFEAAVQHLRDFAKVRSAFVLDAVKTAGFLAEDSSPRLASWTLAGASSTGAVTPGTLIILTGSNLASQTAQAGAYPLPRELASVTMAVGGIHAPILSVDPSRIIIQVPWDLPSGDADLVLDSAGILSNSLVLTLSEFAPKILAAVRASDTITIYALGLGPVTSTPDSGAPSPSAPLAYTSNIPGVTVDDASAQVLFSGLAPGYLGLYQVNVRIPAGVDPTRVTITAGGQSDSSTIAR